MFYRQHFATWDSKTHSYLYSSNGRLEIKNSLTRSQMPENFLLNSWLADPWSNPKQLHHCLLMIAHFLCLSKIAWVKRAHSFRYCIDHLTYCYDYYLVSYVAHLLFFRLGLFWNQGSLKHLLNLLLNLSSRNYIPLSINIYPSET